MAEVDVLYQAMSRAEKLSGQLIGGLRDSLRELEAISTDIEQATSIAGDTPGIGDALTELDEAFDKVLESAKEIVGTIDSLQDVIRQTTNTLQQLQRQYDAASEETEEENVVKGVAGVKGVQGVRK